MTGGAAPKTRVMLESPELVIQTEPVRSMAILDGVASVVVSAAEVLRKPVPGLIAVPLVESTVTLLPEFTTHGLPRPSIATETGASRPPPV